MIFSEIVFWCDGISPHNIFKNIVRGYYLWWMIIMVQPRGTIMFLHTDGVERYVVVKLNGSGVANAMWAPHGESIPMIVVLPESQRGKTWVDNLVDNEVVTEVRFEEDKVIELRALLVGSKHDPVVSVDWSVEYGHGVRTPDTAALLKVLQS